MYDVAGGLPVLLDDGARKDVWGPKGLAYTVDAATGAVQVAHADGLGSVRALTDTSGTLVQTYQTDAFGVPTATQGTSSQPFGFTGEQRDAATGLVYLRARYYDSGAGRFVQRDAVAKSGPGVSGWNRYAYAAENPVSVVDPSGRTGILVAAPVLGLSGPAVVIVGGVAIVGYEVYENWDRISAWGSFAADRIGTLFSARTKTDRLKEHLTPTDIEGAKRDLAGNPVLKPDGTPWQHRKEVREAQQGLLGRIEKLKRDLDEPRLTDEEREAAEAELGEASRLLDWTEEQAGRLGR